MTRKVAILDLTKTKAEIWLIRNIHYVGIQYQKEHLTNWNYQLVDKLHEKKKNYSRRGATQR